MRRAGASGGNLNRRGYQDTEVEIHIAALIEGSKAPAYKLPDDSG